MLRTIGGGNSCRRRVERAQDLALDVSATLATLVVLVVILGLPFLAALVEVAIG